MRPQPTYQQRQLFTAQASVVRERSWAAARLRLKGRVSYMFHENWVYFGTSARVRAGWAVLIYRPAGSGAIDKVIHTHERRLQGK